MKANRRKRSVASLVDANATLVTSSYDGIGAFFSRTHNAGTAVSSQFLDECGLWVPATFEDYATSCRGTHYNGDGITFSRIDHIAIPITALPRMRNTFVDHAAGDKL